MGRGLEFEQFVKDILERSQDIELTASPGPYGPDYGLDFVASRDGRPVLIQVKVTTPQTSHPPDGTNRCDVWMRRGRHRELGPKSSHTQREHNHDHHGHAA